jgi:anti-sigma regulatory factor (Ser/Thr protein kinase)
VGEARRQVAKMVTTAGLGEVPRERVSLVVNELGSNLVKHGGGGELIARVLGVAEGIEVLALDRGAGMANVDACFDDGYSTAGSAGTGLGAVRRLASFVDVYSARPGGTAIVARVAGVDTPARQRNGFDVGAVWAPMTGEDVCGDGWAVRNGEDGRYAVLVVDGLGHGLGASDASRTAERIFDAAPSRPPAGQVAAMHDGLRGTRGAAVAVASIDPRRATLIFAGIGNIAATIVTGDGTRQLVSLSGTAGHAVRHITEFTYPWVEGAVLIMHTDGLGGRWDIERYPGLARHDPSLVAGVLFRDWSRRRDDVTVIAARARRA